jgi:sarcosine oxidase subunit beta
VLQIFSKKAMWRQHELKNEYDVVIIGGGVHGLSIAYYLGKRGVTNVAVLDRAYLGGGASARTTAIIRANYITPQGIPFFQHGLKLYEGLSQELNFNILFTQMGRLDLGHTESAVYGLRIRADFNKLLGVDSTLIGPSEVKKLVPAIDLREGKTLPIMAALYHPSGGVLRHDAVVWGYARGADKLGAELHSQTDVLGIDTENGQVTGVNTSRGHIKTKMVVNSTAGWASTIARMVDVDLPIVTHPLEACVTEPLKPFIDKTVSSANLHTYVYQTDRGEVVMGGAVDPYPTYSQRSTLAAVETLAAHGLEMFPCLREVRLLRQWSGLCDMTPDYAPVMGEAPGLRGFILNCGWGTYGFKVAPAAGEAIAELIATGNMPKLIAPFTLSRFAEGRLVNERASAPAAALQ